MDKGTKKYRNMMKNMEKDMMRPDDIEQTTADLSQDPNLRNLMLPPMPMSKLMEMLKDVPQETITKGIEEGAKVPSGTVIREGEMMGGMSMEDRQAIEALTTMGISLEDAIEAVMGTVPEGMGGGALQALPMQRPAMRSVIREGEMDDMGADRTENPMNTLTSRNAPST